MIHGEEYPTRKSSRLHRTANKSTSFLPTKKRSLHDNKLTSITNNEVSETHREKKIPRITNNEIIWKQRHHRNRRFERSKRWGYMNDPNQEINQHYQDYLNNNTTTNYNSDTSNINQTFWKIEPHGNQKNLSLEIWPLLPCTHNETHQQKSDSTPEICTITTKNGYKKGGLSKSKKRQQKKQRLRELKALSSKDSSHSNDCTEFNSDTDEVILLKKT